MDVPFYTVCKADPAVLALLGSPEPRIYPFGEAPQQVTKPYVVYQWVGGAPLNMINCRPDADQTSLQVDVYAPTQAASTTIAKAIRYAIETECYITLYIGNQRDEETKLYRTTFRLDWLVNR